MVVLAHRCAYHADRPAFAVCMACKTAVCQECATVADGINYCRRCLDARAAKQHVGGRAWKRIKIGLRAIAALVLLAVAARLMVWALAVIASWM
jgi:hypothetical protein